METQRLAGVPNAILIFSEKEPSTRFLHPGDLLRVFTKVKRGCFALQPPHLSWTRLRWRFLVWRLSSHSARRKQYSCVVVWSHCTLFLQKVRAFELAAILSAVILCKTLPHG